MSRIKGKNTKPERLVRSLLHGAGYRFTVNGPKNRKLPGKPDIVLPKYKSVIFVNGCFWHHHKNCKSAHIPKTRPEWWTAKFERNVANDRKNQAALAERGWNVIVIWECELKDPDAALTLLLAELSRAATQTIQYPTAEEEERLIAAERQAGYRLKKKSKSSR